MDSRELFSKDQLTDNELIKAAMKVLKVNKEDILVIHDVDGWLKKENQSVIFEYVGLLDKEDTEDHIGYYYYNIYFCKDEFLSKLKDLEKEFSREVIVTI